MFQGISTNYLILAVFVSLAAVNCINEYDELLDVGYRPMPAELAVEMLNKTSFELKMEECMNDLITCMGSIGKNPIKICATGRYLQWKNFNTLCDMLYDNCKGFGPWHFMSDGECPPAE